MPLTVGLSVAASESGVGGRTAGILLFVFLLGLAAMPVGLIWMFEVRIRATEIPASVATHSEEWRLQV